MPHAIRLLQPSGAAEFEDLRLPFYDGESGRRFDRFRSPALAEAACNLGQPHRFDCFAEAAGDPGQGPRSLPQSSFRSCIV